MNQKNNIIIFLITVTIIVILFAVQAFLQSSKIEKTFVAGTNEKTWYIKSEECSPEVYEKAYKDTRSPFETICRAYTTDGEFVYYGGLSIVQIFTPPPVIINGKFSSSTAQIIQKPKSKIIKGADVKTFEIVTKDFLSEKLNPEKNPTLTYSRDKNSLYREGKLVIDADPKTFIILGSGYLKDTNTVYLRGKKLAGSDPKTFEILKFRHAKDNKNVYFEGRKIVGLDPSTFEFLEFGYAKDKNLVYLTNSRITLKGSDGASFEILSRDYAKDKNFVYYKKNKLENIDSKTFEVIYQKYGNTISSNTSGYTKDKNFLYYKNKRVEDVDPKTFEIINFGGIHAKDKDFAYSSRLEKILWVDAETLEYVSNSYFKDKNNVYYGMGKIIEGADPKTFQDLLGRYLKDKNWVWKIEYAGHGDGISSISKILEADSSTFELMKLGYAHDKNFVYLNGTLIDGAEPYSSIVLNNKYIKDENSVYFMWDKLRGADTETFEVLDYTYAKDKKMVYRNSVALIGVLPKSFELLSCTYAKDGFRVFVIKNEGMVSFIEGADNSSFEVIENSCYAKDKNSIYFVDRLLVGDVTYKKIFNANVETFELINYFYSKDIESVYYNGVKMDDANPNTFQIVDAFYTKDNSFVYYNGVVMPNADAKTFKLFGFNQFAKDKNSTYKKGVLITKKEMQNEDVVLPFEFDAMPMIPSQIHEIKTYPTEL